METHMHTTRRADPRRAKERDMGRSVLPSTARRDARRTLASVRRKHRRAVAQDLASWRDTRPCACGDLDENWDCPGNRCDGVGPDYPLSEHLEAVRERRGADKIGPLQRWAGERIEGLKAELGVVGPATAADAADLARCLRSVLPPGVIGWHAMGHLRWLIEEPWWRRMAVTPTVPSRRDRLVDLARWALETGRHRQLNTVVKAAALPLSPFASRTSPDARFAALTRGDDPRRWTRAWGVAWRPLHGAHDVEAWAGATAGFGYHHDAAGAVMAWAGDLGWYDPRRAHRGPR
jgi:hypothetical protein